MGGKREISRRFKLLWTVLKKFDRDHGFFLSAGITFNLIICFNIGKFSMVYGSLSALIIFFL